VVLSEGVIIIRESGDTLCDSGVVCVSRLTVVNLSKTNYDWRVVEAESYCSSALNRENQIRFRSYTACRKQQT